MYPRPPLSYHPISTNYQEHLQETLLPLAHSIDNAPKSQARYRSKNGESRWENNDSIVRTRPNFNHNAKEQKRQSPDTCESDRSHTSDIPESTKTYKKHYNNKLKVELCKNFVAKGYCPYENRCKFAHGLTELRTQVPQHSDLYRTRPCKTFHELGQCRFGDRCNFRHCPLSEAQKPTLISVRGQWRCALLEAIAQLPRKQSQSKLLTLLSPPSV